ncbi:MAG: hypothetical protein LBM70_08170 [Victivallales bacterium]|jgi:hypothetical protein|nr:hypothetical protein [Victivallales bacterium]
MKMFLFISSLGLTTLLFSSGCASVKELNSAMNDAASIGEISSSGLRIVKNKTTKKEVFGSIGAPGLVFKNDISGESWVYPRVAVRQSNLDFQASGNFSAIFPYSAGSLSKGGGVAGVNASSRLGSSKSSYKSAGLLIEFNELGCVNNYKFTATSF